MKRFDSYVNAIYAGNTLPEVSVANCWPVAWKLTAGIREDLACIDKAWAAYVPAKVSGDRERQAANALRLTARPAFRAG